MRLNAWLRKSVKHGFGCLIARLIMFKVELQIVKGVSK